LLAGAFPELLSLVVTAFNGTDKTFLCVLV